jgi:hypothetical protein
VQFVPQEVLAVAVLVVPAMQTAQDVLAVLELALNEPMAQLTHPLVLLCAKVPSLQLVQGVAPADDLE